LNYNTEHNYYIITYIIIILILLLLLLLLEHNYYIILFAVYENLTQGLKETGKLEIKAPITRNTGNYKKETARKREFSFPKASPTLFRF